MKTFVVLGMHRSATSLCAKGLHEAGVHMGTDLLGAIPSNPFGHYENRAFVQLNDVILSAAGGSWDNPPPEKDIVKAGMTLRTRIRETIERESAGQELWGWKDPRTTLTIKCYWDYLVNPHIFACFRHPVSVAKSLAKRDGFSLAEGVRLAAEYNTRLLDFMYNCYLTGGTIEKGD